MHTLRRMQIGNDSPILMTSELVKRMIETSMLPSVQEQADNMIRILGEYVLGPGEMQRMSDDSHGALIGTQSPKGFLFVLRGLEKSRLIELLETQDDQSAMLTFEGWRRWEELRRGAVSGSKAFMAMPYGDARLDRIVNEWFRPAVSQTGFRLVRLER